MDDRQYLANVITTSWALDRHRAQQHGDAAHGLLNLLCLHHLGRGVPPQRQVLLQPSSCLPPPITEIG